MAADIQHPTSLQLRMETVSLWDDVMADKEPYLNHLYAPKMQVRAERVCRALKGEQQPFLSPAGGAARVA